jgi:hypothetical protein
MIKEAAISILRFLPDEHCFSPCPSMRLVYTTTNNNSSCNHNGSSQENAHTMHVNLPVNCNNNDDDEERQQHACEQESSSPLSVSVSSWLLQNNDSCCGLSLGLVLPRPSAAWMDEYRKWNYFGRNGIGHPVFSTSRDLRDFNEKGRLLIQSLTKDLAPFLHHNEHVTVDDFLDLYNLQVGDWAAWWHIRDLNYPGLIVPIQQLPVNFELKSRLMMWRSMLGCNIQSFYHNQQYIECFNRQGQILQRLIHKELSGENQSSSNYDCFFGPIQIDDKNSNGMMMAAKASVDDDDDDDDGDGDYITSDTSNSSSSHSCEDSMTTVFWRSSDDLSGVGPQDHVILDAITIDPPPPPVSHGYKEFSAVKSISQGIHAMSI